MQQQQQQQHNKNPTNTQHQVKPIRSIHPSIHPPHRAEPGLLLLPAGWGGLPLSLSILLCRAVLLLLLAPCSWLAGLRLCAVLCAGGVRALFRPPSLPCLALPSHAAPRSGCLKNRNRLAGGDVDGSQGGGGGFLFLRPASLHAPLVSKSLALAWFLVRALRGCGRSPNRASEQARKGKNQTKKERRKEGRKEGKKERKKERTNERTERTATMQGSNEILLAGSGLRPSLARLPLFCWRLFPSSSFTGALWPKAV